MTDRAILKDDNPRQWAINAAKQDATYLISPRARMSALDILDGDETVEGRAARRILFDGANQQGSMAQWKGKEIPWVSMNQWKAAAELLGVFDNE